MTGSSPTNFVTNTIVFTLVFRSFIVGSSLLLATLFTRIEHVVLYVTVLFSLNLAVRIYKDAKTKLTRLSVVYYDGDCRFCICTLRLLSSVLRFRYVRFLRGDFDPEINSRMNKENSWIVQDSNGSLNLRSAGLIVLLRTSHYHYETTRIFNFGVRAIQKPLDSLYSMIAEHREFLSKLISCK